MAIQIFRGDVFYADLNPAKGSEQGGYRPVLVVQNNLGNKYSPTVLVAPITSKTAKKTALPTHCMIHEDFLDVESMILFEHLKTISKERLGRYLGRVSLKTMNSYGKAIKISTGLVNPIKEKKKHESRRNKRFLRSIT